MSARAGWRSTASGPSSSGAARSTIRRRFLEVRGLLLRGMGQVPHTYGSSQNLLELRICCARRSRLVFYGYTLTVVQAAANKEAVKSVLTAEVGTGSLPTEGVT